MLISAGKYFFYKNFFEVCFRIKVTLVNNWIRISAKDICVQLELIFCLQSPKKNYHQLESMVSSTFQLLTRSHKEDLSGSFQNAISLAMVKVRTRKAGRLIGIDNIFVGLKEGTAISGPIGLNVRPRRRRHYYKRLFTAVLDSSQLTYSNKI